MELRNALSRTFGLELPGSLAFDCPTAAAVAEYIVGALGTSSRVDAAQQPAHDLHTGAVMGSLLDWAALHLAAARTASQHPCVAAESAMSLGCFAGAIQQVSEYESRLMAFTAAARVQLSV